MRHDTNETTTQIQYTNAGNLGGYRAHGADAAGGADTADIATVAGTRIRAGIVGIDAADYGPDVTGEHLAHSQGADVSHTVSE